MLCVLFVKVMMNIESLEKLIQKVKSNKHPWWKGRHGGLKILCQEEWRAGSNPAGCIKGEWCNGSHASLRNWCLERVGSNPTLPMNRLQYDGKQFKSLNSAIH